MRELIVLGGGESGVGAAILGKAQGFDVFLSDSGSLKPQYRALLLRHKIRFEENGHAGIEILRADEVVKSPGIPDETPIVQRLLECGISVISEVEFAARYTDATIIGITGSNGKTTTASLIHHILKGGGVDAGLGGNTGQGFAHMVAVDPHAVYVLEVSSFQLDNIRDFKPNIAVITNIVPDHLDRYAGDFESYAAAKFKIAMNQDAQGVFIYNADDETIVSGLETYRSPVETYAFSTDQTLAAGAWVAGDEIQFKTCKNSFTMRISDLALSGKHNVQNSMAAGLAASLMQIKKETIRQSLSDFTAVPHRLEPVLKIHQMHFVNDSKATNVNAAFYALQSMGGPTVWIAGGLDKGNDYSDLLPLVKEKVRAIIALGADNSKIVGFFEAHVPIIVETTSMKGAVKTAYALGKKGDKVLLSPACASFDLFESYVDRGNQFKAAVKKL